MGRMKAYARLAVQFLVAYTMVFQQMPVAAFAQQAAAEDSSEAAQPAEQQEAAADETEVDQTPQQEADAGDTEAAQPGKQQETDNTVDNETQEAENGRSDEPNSTETEQWSEFGTCLWSIDNYGLLTIKPKNENTEGTIGVNQVYTDTYPWENRKGEIRSIRFEGNIKAEGNIQRLFSGCFNLESIDFSSLDTSRVTDMSSMFSGCSSLESLDLSSLDTSSVTNMDWMFYGCSRLTSLDLSSFDTSSVTRMGSMFCDCSSLASLDLSSFDTSKVTGMEGMFSGFHHDLSLSRIAIPKDFKPKNDLPKECKGFPILWETADGISLSTAETNTAGIYYAKVNIKKSYFNVDTENCGYTGTAIVKKIEPTEDYLQLKKTLKT